MSTIDSLIEFYGEPISVYTRAQAIADGQLVAVGPAIAAEAGYNLPVEFTAAAWADLVAWTPETEKRKTEGTGQDESGRLWDVLWMMRAAAKRCAAEVQSGQGAARNAFTLYRVPPTGRGVMARKVAAAVHMGGGDNGEPVLTLMLPGES